MKEPSQSLNLSLQIFIPFLKIYELLARFIECCSTTVVGPFLKSVLFFHVMNSAMY